MSTALLSLAIAIFPFAVSMSFTPGPNNLMLANAGAQFGFARTLPHLAGVVGGFAVLTLAVGLGIASLLATMPTLFLAMKIAGICYLLYFAWHVATAETAEGGAAGARPMTAFEAAAFQWINPKAWIMVLGAVTTYTRLSEDFRLQVGVIVAVFALVGLASSSTWTVFGQIISRYLTTRSRRVAFNWTMAALLVASIVPVCVEMVTAF